jgi:hypothetical protein
LSTKKSEKLARNKKRSGVSESCHLSVCRVGAELDPARRRLDEAFFAAYGWKSDLSDEEILEELLALNLERSPSEPRK